jgi:hypothetical protein
MRGGVLLGFLGSGAQTGEHLVEIVQNDVLDHHNFLLNFAQPLQLELVLHRQFLAALSLVPNNFPQGRFDMRHKCSKCIVVMEWVQFEWLEHG